jgi:hypothetical protein
MSRVVGNNAITENNTTVNTDFLYSQALKRPLIELLSTRFSS